MGFFGNLIGQGLGALGSQLFPIPGVSGQELGGHLGNLLPFARGGVVPTPVRRAYQRGGKVSKPSKSKKSKPRK